LNIACVVRKGNYGDGDRDGDRVVDLLFWGDLEEVGFLYFFFRRGLDVWMGREGGVVCGELFGLRAGWGRGGFVGRRCGKSSGGVCANGFNVGFWGR
jgi:hypothetical protein